MSRILIIGYGNPQRGDDGFGWLAAERLRERIGDPDVDVLTVPQLLPELVEQVAQAGRVIFIDASSEGEPGKLNCRVVGCSAPPRSFTHETTPEALLAAAKTLFGRAPEAVIYTVRCQRVDIGAALTPDVEHVLEQAVDRIGAISY